MYIHTIDDRNAYELQQIRRSLKKERKTCHYLIVNFNGLLQIDSIQNFKKNSSILVGFPKLCTALMEKQKCYSNTILN